MENLFNDIEDFLTNESFRSWVKNPTPELDAQWQRWIAENPGKKALLDQSKEIILNLRFKEFQPDSNSKQRILNRIKQETKPQAREVSFRNMWYKVAAVLALVGGIGALIYFNTLNPSEVAPIASVDLVQKINAAGVKSQHMLSDGSKVYLNSGSSIEYPKNFDTDSRVVKLTGEAFFQVAHDSNRPFKVQTEDFEVVVLGTKFNVNSKTDNPAVALVEGKVRLQTSLAKATLELDPGQMATFDNAKGSFNSTSFDPDYVTGWKDGKLVFRESSLDEVLEKLHLWYGIDISMTNKPKSADWSYTATFKNESLESVLLNMSTLRRFDYQIKNDSLIISFQ